MNHPDLTNPLLNLGALYQEQERYKEAIPVSSRALEIVIRFYPERSTRVLQLVYNLAFAYLNTGQYKKAEEYYLRFLGSKSVKTLQPPSPETISAINGLALTFREQRDYARMWLALQELIIHQEAVLGSDTPQFAKALRDVAVRAQATGETGWVREIEMRAARIIAAP